ncbi:GDSL-like Lipase/Acylhydrolase [Rubripirellula obstinata]|uniref:GDSL-like Lipase/Acylhydrolase n=2 Tax=Rubripirellula obstinata TaxID=406547 RepID=A0A5B1CGS2_9BACT|nr:SGNH/GDSL hydrolase family protein [Rubripirellula obstinata]KAA1258404.1 GDSL-like Lipase/Acylhydrolase [Rubripirellula obstinata]
MAIALGVIASLALGEVALRLYLASRGWTANCYVTSLALVTSDADAGYTLRKNVEVKSSGYHIKLNSMGLRGPEVSKTNSDDKVRIAVMGGSSVFGYLVPEGEDSCRVMEEALQQVGFDAEVINGGVNGYNITQCRHRYEKVIAPLRPDIVILYLGWNDTGFLITDTKQSELQRTPPAPSWIKRTLARSTLYGFLRFRLFPNPSPVFAPPQSPNSRVTKDGGEAFRRDYIALIESVKASGAVPVISTQLMASSQHCEGLESFLGDAPEQIAANQAIGQWVANTVRQLAIEHDLLLIDCNQIIPCNKTTLGDPIHLTQEGHRQVAQAWLQGIKPLLDRSGLNDANPIAIVEDIQ